MLKIGVIGYGVRINSIVKLLLDSGEVALESVMDIDNEAVRTKFLSTVEFKSVRFYDDAKEMLEKEKLDGVCIGTRCSTHTEYALLVSKYNIPIFLEKPVCTNYDDLEKLKTISNMNEKVVVSFPMRLSKSVEFLKKLIDSGKIGSIEHVQCYNNATNGRVYYHTWYRDEDETGGLFLQKATHDLDYINYLLGDLKPVRLCAMKSKQIFKGDKPAGLKCADCNEAETCPESPRNVTKSGDINSGEYCCFAKDTGNEDSGSVIIEYNSGMHVVYSQNFIVRNGAGKRGARLVGYKGTIEFDWINASVTVYRHDMNTVETYSFANESGHHFGGDKKLTDNFVNVMKNEETSHSKLQDGIASAALCLGAKKSATEHKFVEL